MPRKGSNTDVLALVSAKTLEGDEFREGQGRHLVYQKFGSPFWQEKNAHPFGMGASLRVEQERVRTPETPRPPFCAKA
jgi:hypothetical protein